VRGNDLELAWDRPFHEWPRYGVEDAPTIDAPPLSDERPTGAVAERIWRGEVAGEGGGRLRASSRNHQFAAIHF
jgi:hypothetical protein